MMRERDFTGSRAQAAADQRRHAGGMMRRAKRPAVGERAALDLAGDRSDHGYFEQFCRRERRKNGWQPGGEHRFPRPGRSDHEHVILSMPNQVCRASVVRNFRGDVDDPGGTFRLGPGVRGSWNSTDYRSTVGRVAPNIM